MQEKTPPASVCYPALYLTQGQLDFVREVITSIANIPLKHARGAADFCEQIAALEPMPPLPTPPATVEPDAPQA